MRLCGAIARWLWFERTDTMAREVWGKGQIWPLGIGSIWKSERVQAFYLWLTQMLINRELGDKEPKKNPGPQNQDVFDAIPILD